MTATKGRKRSAPRLRSRRKPLGTLTDLPEPVASIEHQDTTTWRGSSAVAFLRKRGLVAPSREFHDVEAQLRFPAGSPFDAADYVKLTIDLRWVEHRAPRADEEGLGILGTRPRMFEVPITLDPQKRTERRRDVLIEATAAEIVALHTALGAAIARARMKPGRHPVFYKR